MGSPGALGVEATAAAAANTEEVSPSSGLSLRGNDITLLALRAVSVGLLQFSKLELMHNSLVVIDA